MFNTSICFYTNSFIYFLFFSMYLCLNIKDNEIYLRRHSRHLLMSSSENSCYRVNVCFLSVTVSRMCTPAGLEVPAVPLCWPAQTCTWEQRTAQTVTCSPERWVQSPLHTQTSPGTLLREQKHILYTRPWLHTEQGGNLVPPLQELNSQ